MQIFYAVPVIILLALPQWISNYMTWGKLSPDNVGKRQLIGTLQPNYFFVNLLKNLSYNWGTTKSLQNMISDGVHTVSRFLNVDINHPSIAEDGKQFVFPSLPAYDCDSALNILVMILLLICFIWFMRCVRK